jgi:hypothetical protein
LYLTFATAGSEKISLGFTSSYGLVSGYGIDNQGTSVIKENTGILETLSMDSPSAFTCIEDASNASAAAAQSDAKTAFN